MDGVMESAAFPYSDRGDFFDDDLSDRGHFKYSIDAPSDACPVVCCDSGRNLTNTNDATGCLVSFMCVYVASCDGTECDRLCDWENPDSLYDSLWYRSEFDRSVGRVTGEFGSGCIGITARACD